MLTSKIGIRLLGTFEKVIIINLAERTDRRHQMVDQLGYIGLELSQRVTFLEASRFEESGDFPTAGARGCFESHRRAIQIAKAERCKSVLILEDDCDFLKDGSHWDSVLAALECTPWAIFYGGYQPFGGFKLPKQIPAFCVPPQIPIQCSHCIGFKGEVLSTASEYLSAMLDRPSGSTEGGPMHVDGAYTWFRAAHPELQTWAAHPQLARQRPSRTSIHDLPWFDRGLMRPFSTVAREVRRILGRSYR